ncbi:MAG: hypothetical protein ACLGIG_07565 [Actinomycetes bacterium]
MGTVHCPLCGLRFRHGTELAQHARDDHSPAPQPETRETVVVPRAHHVVETPLDQVLAKKREEERRQES